MLWTLAVTPGGDAQLPDESMSVRIARRLGDPPRKRGSYSSETCPDLFELTDGNFAVIGTEATTALDPHLPPDAARADYERIVVITRETLIRAKKDIPDV
ncbi:hypothetical protein GCM10010276_58060 [Streptomyces longisporus]|uniref:Uncharacterized protein n=2 Tax=Streptomyces TaxID=1883 RepID=A0ABP5ZWR0_STRLO